MDVTVSADGIGSATGTLTVEFPATGPIEVLDLVAGSPTPNGSGTVENPSVSNGGGTSSFTDTGVLLSDDTKHYVIEAN